MRLTVSRRARWTGFLAAGALALTGCADSSERETDQSSGEGDDSLSKAEIYTQGWVGEGRPSDAEPQQGGTLTMADYAETRTLNPAQTYATGASGGNALAAVYDTLVRYDHDADAWTPQLAESLEPNDDNTVWTLTLPEGVTFSDGTPLNADAVIGSLEYYMANYGYQSLTMISSGTEMKKVDDRTVEFTVAVPWATFPAMLAGGPGMIMAPAAYDDPENFEPIGAGAFTLENYAPAEELVLTAREDYHGGAPNIEKLRFVWLASDDARVESFSADEVDAGFIRNPQAVEGAREQGIGGYMFVVGAGSQLTINAREGRPGADPRVRQAIAHALDVESYLERSTDGAGIPSKAIFAETSPWATDAEPREFDQEKAKELLDAAKADGYDGKLSYVAAADPTAQKASVQLEAQLEAVGFDVTVESLDNIADIIRRVYVEYDFDTAQGATSIPNEDPFGAMSEWLFSKSPTNGAGYVSEEMDGLLRQLQAVGDDPESAEAQEVMTQIEELVHEDVPAVIYNPAGNLVMMQEDVHGIVPTVQTISLFDDAWIDQE